MQEQRAARRFHVLWFLHAGHRKVGAIRGRVVNISRSGFLFLSPKRYRIGDLVEIDISLGVGSYLRGIARIVREEPAPAGQYVYGAEFQHMTEMTRALLDDTLAAIRQKEFGDEPFLIPWYWRYE